ncbi:MAG: hypothetical protein OJF62_001168 [Pseudolabrys sp.]|jgi:uncharacterized cupin superfamily protein|nr:hypothetical protein [Pseudolabrys sp.]
MPKIDFGKAAVRTASNYPPDLKKAVEGREKTVLGDVAGLTQFGVNLTRLRPGAASSLRHWHENEDEFVYMVEGELWLVENDKAEVLLRPGEAAGFKAGVPNGHMLINRSARDAVYLEIGTRASSERAHYPDHDLAFERGPDGVKVTRKNGEPY